MGAIKKTFRCEIASDECKGCGRCIEACPKHLLSIGSKLNVMSFTYAVCSNDGCLGCSACYYMCPEPGAISIVQIEDDGEEN